MRVAIVSDIHGNRPAFEAVLGDLVGYGAEPDACVQLAREHADLCLVGNHDLAVRGDLPLTEFSRGAALAAEWTKTHMKQSNLDFLGELEPADVNQVVGLYHASPRDPVWEYVLSSLQADLCLDAQRHRVCLIGHSHVALAFGRDEDQPTAGEIRAAGTELDVSSGEWLLNPGSVGQPRDGDPRAAWLELDTDAWMARWKRVPYDIGVAAAAIRAADLPESLADRLQYGQ
jgi:diadenosine tetraphosphatase ApaH/serine/threonine PP2A family protein phosphatase